MSQRLSTFGAQRGRRDRARHAGGAEYDGRRRRACVWNHSLSLSTVRMGRRAIVPRCISPSF